jgi:hypothetical protein
VFHRRDAGDGIHQSALALAAAAELAGPLGDVAAKTLRELAECARPASSDSQVLFHAVAAFLCFGDAFGFPELVDHEVSLVAFDDALQLLVLMAGRDDEPIALFVSLVVLAKRQVDGLRAAFLAALADDSELILGSFAQLLARALDFPIDRSVHGLVP